MSIPDPNFSVLKRNRHRSVPPYEWHGPDPEPNPAGDGCVCRGCHARRVVEAKKEALKRKE